MEDDSDDLPGTRPVIEVQVPKVQPGVSDASRHDNLGSTLQSLGSDSLVYVVGAALLGLGNFVLVPLFTRRLSPHDFGLYALIDIAVLILVSITQMKLDVAYLRFFALSDQAERSSLLGTTVIAGGISGIVGGALLAGAVWLAKVTWLPGIDQSVAWTLLPIVVLENLQGLLLSDLRARRRAMGYCFSSVIRLFATVGATVWALSAPDGSVFAVFLGRLLGDVIGIAVMIFLCARHVSLALDLGLLRRMSAFGFPIVWSSLMVLLMDASGRVFLTRLSGLDQVGYLAVAVKISGVFQVMITQPFGIAWGGFMFQIAKLPQAATIYSKILAYTILVASAMGVVMVVLTAPLFRIFAPVGYDAAIALLPLAVLVRALNLAEYPCAIGIYLSGRTKWLALFYSAGLLVNLVLNQALVARFGVRGVMWAWLAGWLVVIVLVLSAGQRLYPIRLQWGLITLACLPWLAVLLSAQWAESIFRLGLGWQAAIATAVVIITGVFIIRDVKRMRGNLQFA